MRCFFWPEIYEFLILIMLCEIYFLNGLSERLGSLSISIFLSITLTSGLSDCSCEPLSIRTYGGLIIHFRISVDSIKGAQDLILDVIILHLIDLREELYWFFLLIQLCLLLRYFGCGYSLWVEAFWLCRLYRRFKLTLKLFWYIIMVLLFNFH